MRTTLTLDDDVAAMLLRIQKRRKAKFRQIVNEALREGLQQLQRPRKPRAPYRIDPVSLGPSLIGDLNNVGEALAVSEGEAFR